MKMLISFYEIIHFVDRGQQFQKWLYTDPPTTHQHTQDYTFSIFLCHDSFYSLFGNFYLPAEWTD